MQIISKNSLNRAAAMAADRCKDAGRSRKAVPRPGKTTKTIGDDGVGQAAGNSEQLRQVFGDPGSELARLEKALRTERRLGQAGHWSYDLNRHIALVQSYRREIDRIDIEKNSGK